MTSDNQLVLSIFEGWCAYQEVMTKAIAPLDEKQLELRAAPNLRSVREIAAHIIEHDLHHGGEISITLGAHGMREFAL